MSMVDVATSRRTYVFVARGNAVIHRGITRDPVEMLREYPERGDSGVCRNAPALGRTKFACMGQRAVRQTHPTCIDVDSVRLIEDKATPCRRVRLQHPGRERAAGAYL